METKVFSYLLGSQVDIGKRERYKEDNGRDQQEQTNTKSLKTPPGMAGAEPERTGDEHQSSFHNIIHRDCPLGALHGILGDGTAGMTLLAEVLNSGLKILTHTTNSLTRPKRLSRSTTV